MKSFGIKVNLVLLITVLGYWGCGEFAEESSLIQFSEPQPSHEKTLQEFPRKIRGAYISLNDSSILQINSKSISRERDYWVKISKSMLDSFFIVDKDSVIDKEDGDKFSQ